MLQPHGLADEIRARLAGRGVQLTKARHTLIAPGEHAPAAWEVFKEIAALPVETTYVDPEGDEWRIDPAPGGDVVAFGAGPGEAEPLVQQHIDAPPGPRVYVVDAIRTFTEIGEDGEFSGHLSTALTVEFPPAPDLMTLPVIHLEAPGGRCGAVWERDPRDVDPPPLADVASWISAVEASESWRAAFGRHQAGRIHLSST
ncbi:MAG TPA: hypothetical protein VF533_16610 [Solirubrobacteraceae bacterium]